MTAGALRSRTTVVIATLLALAGCVPSTEDRITDAMPLSPAVVEARRALAADTGKGDRVVAEFAGRVRMRAIDCARGRRFDWWASDDELRRALAPERACFAVGDEALLQWLRWRRVGLELERPALRPLPATPAALHGSGGAIGHVAFASGAGVAAIAYDGAVAWVGTQDGGVLASAPVAGPGEVALSPNGRIAAIGLRDTVLLRGVDGDDYGAIDGVAQGRGWWVADTVLAFADARDDALRIVDFAQAREARSTALTGLHGVMPLRGMPGHALALSKQGAALLVVPPAGPVYTPVASIAPLPGMSALEGDRAITPEGRVFGLAEGGVLVATRDAGDPAHLRFDGRPRRLDFAGLPLQGVQASADPDRLLLALPGDAGMVWYAYSLSRHELAPLQPPLAADARLDYVPALRRNVAIDADGVRVLDRIDTGPAESPDALATRFGAKLPKGLLADVEPVAPTAAAPPPSPPAPSSTFNGRAVPPQPVEGGGPFAQINGRVVAVPDAKPAPPRAPPPPGPPLKGRAALVDGLRRGVLRPATEADYTAWKRSYEQQVRHGVPREFEEHLRFGDRYVITGDFTVPDDLTGAASAVFILERGAPFPNGEASHSPILDINSGACLGWVCRSLSGED
jgi:hypothetical protein